MTDAEGWRALVRSGWRVLRNQGSHVVMARGDKRLVVCCGRRGKHSLSAGQVAKIRKAVRA